MTRKEVKILKKEDIVYDKKYGFPFIVKGISPVWNGFLSNEELETKKPNRYYIIVAPVKEQDYAEIYKFQNTYTFGAGLMIDSRKLRM